MRFLHILTRLNTHKLRHEAVKHILVIFRLIGIRIVEQTEFQQIRVGKIIQGKQVGTRLFKRRAMSLKRIRVYTGQQTA